MARGNTNIGADMDDGIDLTGDDSDDELRNLSEPSPLPKSGADADVPRVFLAREMAERQQQRQAQQQQQQQEQEEQQQPPPQE